LKFLLNYFIDNLKARIFTVRCNLRFDNGSDFEQIGFVKKKEVLGYKFTDYVKTYDDKSVSPVKIYDAGQRLYELSL
jgi:hypothetical protein